MGDPYEPYAQVFNSITIQDAPFPYSIDDDPIYKRYYGKKYGYIPEAERKKQYMRTDYYREMRIASDRDYRLYRQAVRDPGTLMESIDEYQETASWQGSKLRQVFPDAKQLSQAERRRKASPAFKDWAGYDGFKTDGLSPADQLADYDASLDKPAAPSGAKMLPPVRPSYAMDPITGQPKDQFTYDGNLFRAWYNLKISKGEKVDYAKALKKWTDQSSTGNKEFEEDWLGTQKEYLLYEKQGRQPLDLQSKDQAYNDFVSRKNKQNPNYDAASKAFGPGWDDLSPLQQQEQISAYKPPAPAPEPAPAPAPKPPAPKPDPKPDPKPPAPKPDPKPDPKPPAPKPDPKPPAPKPKPPAPKPKKPVDPTPAPSPGPARISGHSPLRIVRFL